jgi:hypothetical protein
MSNEACGCFFCGNLGSGLLHMARRKAAHLQERRQGRGTVSARRRAARRLAGRREECTRPRGCITAQRPARPL